MTNLLKTSLTHNKVVKLPVINFDAYNSDKSIVNKFMTYFGKVRKLNSQEYTHEEVMLFKENFRKFDLEILTYDELIEQFGEDKTNHLVEGITYVIRKSAKNKDKLPSTEKLREILKKVSYIKLPNKKGGYDVFSILEDSHFDIKVDKHTLTYFKRGAERKNLFGIITYSALELMAVAGTCKSSFMFRYWDMVPYLRQNYESAVRYQMNRNYGSNSGKLIATVRDNKKYQDKELNKSTVFNQLGFKEIEIDTQKYEGMDFDYKEFKRVEKDWERICNLVPHAEQVPSLKFRKLGKHKATGLYVPLLNIVAVDVRYTNSFIHEYGHYLDFCLGSYVDQLSTKKEFESILDGYINGLGSMVLPEGFKYDYFTTPTEVFARAFELWVHNKVDGTTVLTKKDKDYHEQVEYAAFSKFNLLEAVYTYFENLFAKCGATEYEVKVINYIHKRKVVEPTNVGEQLVLDLF